MPTSKSKAKSRVTRRLTKEEREQATRYFNANNLLLSPPIKRAAYSDRTAWVMSSMAQLVYEKFEEGGKARALLQAKLKGGNFKLIAEFHDPDTDTQAFLVSNGEYAVLAFRGTEVAKFADIKTDIRASTVSLIEGRVHKGFLGAYKSIEKQILRALKKVKDQPIYITGHSLGAALATVATQHLERDQALRDQIAACYTFGSPRVGNREFDRNFKSAIYRIVNTTDIVSVVPLLAMGYIHIGDVRFLEPSMGDIRRGIPILRRISFFILGAVRLFAPLVGDHAIALYRKKLEAVAQDQNLDLYFDLHSEDEA
ncbi:MAG: lipase family protein [Anaerolineales bacterium]|nr:lipase family protein [Anaerolineales bacterium]